MPLSLFRELIPYIINTDLIYLQGWGEPLLNEDIFEMIRICKDNGRHVGFTTNGMLLNEKIIGKLIDLRLDILGVSFAGTTASTHNRIRKGTDFDLVMSSLERLIKIKHEMSSPVPALHIAYIMLRSNFHELKEIVHHAKRLGARQILANNLSLVVEPGLFDESLFNDPNHTDYYSEVLEAAKDTANREGIIFQYNPITLNDISPRCSENVCRSCVVNVHGEVLPCIFVDPVLGMNQVSEDEEPATYLFKNEPYPLKGFSFGNIGHDRLVRIWHNTRYARFRDLFKLGPLMEPGQFLSNLPDRCVSCYKRLMT
jgi:MoaA/NifB/PqqE/SkfB family radical SAM enzyme